jgi:hypothetical protein
MIIKIYLYLIQKPIKKLKENIIYSTRLLKNMKDQRVEVIVKIKNSSSFLEIKRNQYLIQVLQSKWNIFKIMNRIKRNKEK